MPYERPPESILKITVPQITTDMYRVRGGTTAYVPCAKLFRLLGTISDSVLAIFNIEKDRFVHVNKMYSTAFIKKYGKFPDY